MSEQAVEAFTSVDQTLAAVDEHLKLFTQAPVEQLVAELTPLEKAKVQVGLAYTVNALLYVFLKTQGVSAKDIRQTHVKQELERVKAFIKKIKDAEELAKGPKLKLDKDVSKRMVHSALSSDQVYIKALEEKKTSEDEQERAAELKKSSKKTTARGTADKQQQSKNKRQRKK